MLAHAPESPVRINSTRSILVSGWKRTVKLESNLARSESVAGVQSELQAGGYRGGRGWAGESVRGAAGVRRNAGRIWRDNWLEDIWPVHMCL